MSAAPHALKAAELIDRLVRLGRSGQGGLNPAQWQALRYLARANRFSRTPAALADYLAATRGTVSQTLIALEAKGHVSRVQSERDGRSVDVGLTVVGRDALARDPLTQLAVAIDDALGSQSSVLARGLAATLDAAIRRNGGRAFGTCRACRHFRVVGAPGRAGHCALLDEELTEADAGSICVEQVPAA